MQNNKNLCLLKNNGVSLARSDIPKYGEMRIGYHSVADPSFRTQGIILMFNTDVELYIIGSGRFTDRSLVDDLGTSMTVSADSLTEVYSSNGDYELVITNKYALTYISFNMYGNTLDDRSNKSLYLSDFRYVTHLTHVDLSAREVVGDIASFAYSRKIKYLDLYSSKTCGHISSISKLRAIQHIDLMRTYVQGDYSDLPQAVTFPYVFPLQLS